MRITVTVKPGAKQAKIEEKEPGHFEVWVREPAKENKASFAVLEALAARFGVGLSQVRLVGGRTSRRKAVDILL